VFEIYSGRNKDFADWIMEPDKEERYEILRKMIYGMDEVKSVLYEISDLAMGDSDEDIV